MKRLFYKIRNSFKRTISRDIDYKSLINIVKNNKKVCVLDVRTVDEFNYGHIEMAINIPLQDLEQKIENTIKNKEDIIIVYCQSGGRSKKACDKLEKMGYSNIYNLKNGIRRNIVN